MRRDGAASALAAGQRGVHPAERGLGAREAGELQAGGEGRGIKRWGRCSTKPGVAIFEGSPPVWAGFGGEPKEGGWRILSKWATCNGEGFLRGREQVKFNSSFNMLKRLF